MPVSVRRNLGSAFDAAPGFGGPWERSLEAVQADLDDGYITAEGAVRDYGVVLGASGRIDPVGTAQRRAGKDADSASAAMTEGSP